MFSQKGGHLFGELVTRHAVVLNPAAGVRGPRLSVVEGRTPKIAAPRARTLLASVGADSAVGLRERAVIAALIDTAARVRAVARLRRGDFDHDWEQRRLRFTRRSSFGGREEPRDPLPAPVPETLLARMVKRRMGDAGLPKRLSPHSFRVAAITDLLQQGVPLDRYSWRRGQRLAGHADPRTTRLYDRRDRKVSRNIAERISIQIYVSKHRTSSPSDDAGTIRPPDLRSRTPPSGKGPRG